jgi:ferredoxin-NADP reductase
MSEPLQPAAIHTLPGWDSGRMTMRCLRVEAETHDVATFVFRAQEPMLFGFRPGQFVTIEPVIDGRTVPRCYSVSSTPSRPCTFSITVKREPGGLVSNWLHDHFGAGDSLTVSAPQGDFNIIDRPAERILMLSGGSGITPVMSMLRWLHDTAADVDIHFVHAARSPQDIIFRRELEAMARANDRLRLSITCESTGDGDWSGYQGRLNASMLQQMAPDLMERTVYTCGPEPLMAAVRDILGGLGFPADQYHEESFGGAPPPAPEAETAPAPAPAEDGNVGDVVEARAVETECTVRLARTGIEFTCAPSETLLEAVQNNGAWIPCACQMGVCGSCKVLKTSGDTRMQHMGGISDDDEASGYVLACCTYPTGPVTLDC